MKLQDYGVGGVTVTLPDDLLWIDEFNWSAVSRTSKYSCTGALIIQEGVKLSGRPISLNPPEDTMAWVSRADVAQLYEWANTEDLKLRLTLEYPDDARVFTVMFKPDDENCLEAEPVKGFPNHNDGDHFRVKIKLIEVQP